jgi:hypothetical protein
MTAAVAQTTSLRYSPITFSADASRTASSRYLSSQVFCERLANCQFALPLPPRGSIFPNPYRPIWAEDCWIFLEFASGIALYRFGSQLRLLQISSANDAAQFLYDRCRKI